MPETVRALRMLPGSRPYLLLLAVLTVLLAVLVIAVAAFHGAPVHGIPEAMTHNGAPGMTHN
jgi:hypothetical protein